MKCHTSGSELKNEPAGAEAGKGRSLGLRPHVRACPRLSLKAWSLASRASRFLDGRTWARPSLTFGFALRAFFTSLFLGGVGAKKRTWGLGGGEEHVPCGLSSRWSRLAVAVGAVGIRGERLPRPFVPDNRWPDMRLRLSEGVAEGETMG